MSREDTITLTVFTAINILIYVIAFASAYFKKQSVTIYCVLIGVQLFLLLLAFASGSQSSRSDAAGSGMAQGYFYLLNMCLHAIVMLIVITILLVRVSSVKFWIYFGIIVAIITLCVVAYRNINFKNIIYPPHKESKIKLRIESAISTGNIDRKAKIYAAEKLRKTINDIYLSEGMSELTEEEIISKINLYSSSINESSGTYSLFYDGLFQEHYIIVDVSNTDTPVNARIGSIVE
jgi:hypothetical protein